MLKFEIRKSGNRWFIWSNRNTAKFSKVTLSYAPNGYSAPSTAVNKIKRVLGNRGEYQIKIIR